MKILNKELLLQMIEEGYVKANKHPIADLYIYNYTPKTQFERIWNEVTLQCRGLILDGKFNIVARPFKKFFNYGEQKDLVLPDESFEVFEKMDGSLGILYWTNDKVHIATRGSFTSEQSVVANNLLHSKYKNSIQYLDRKKTYLFEIIYPENRIVVDYGDEQNLTLLAIIDNGTGSELPLENIGFPLTKKLSGKSDIQTLLTLDKENKEGFVIKYTSGLRLKIKHKEYLRLHKIVTQISTYSLWESLKEGIEIEEYIKNIPDEFYDWAVQKKNELNTSYLKIENIAKREFKILENRKETAAYFLSCSYPTIMFAMMDKKKYDQIIWQVVKPEYEKPFRS